MKSLTHRLYCPAHPIASMTLLKHLASPKSMLLRELFAILNSHQLFFLPENARFSLREQSISWTFQNDQKTMSLIPDNSYILPSSYKVEMKIVENDGPWKLVGTVGEAFYATNHVLSQAGIYWKVRNFQAID